MFQPVLRKISSVIQKRGLTPADDTYVMFTEYCAMGSKDLDRPEIRVEFSMRADVIVLMLADMIDYSILSNWETRCRRNYLLRICWYKSGNKISRRCAN